MKTVLMNSAYPEGELGNGVFTDLQEYDVPWKDANIAADLDIVYYSKSGMKTCSDIIISRLNDRGVLLDTYRMSIAKALFAMFGTQWIKLYNTLNFEYDPIENYRMVETENVESHNENSGTETGTVSRDADNQRTDTGTISNSGTNANTDSVYGFNSAQAVNSDASNGTNSNTETRNLTEAESVDDTETRNLANSSENDGTQTRELTRSGNIGVATSQQMINSERELWQWNFFNTVFSDIDSILCLDIYEYEEWEE